MAHPLSRIPIVAPPYADAAQAHIVSVVLWAYRYEAEKQGPADIRIAVHFRLSYCHIGMVPCRHHADVGTVLTQEFSCLPGGVKFQLSSHHFPPFRRKVNVKLRPNFTSKKGFLRAKKRSFYERRILIISHKHNHEG